MVRYSSRLLSTLEQIEVNTTEQVYIDKAIYQLKNEKQREKVVVKNLVRDLRLIMIHNHRLSKPALALFNQLDKPSLGRFPQFPF